MLTELPVVESFWSVEEAQLAKGFLESEGIACQLEGLATAANFWHLNNATGGVRLRTSPADAERAIELLHSIQHHRDSDADEMDDEVLDDPGSAAEHSEAEADQSLDESTTATDDDSYSSPFDLFRTRTWLFLALLLLLIYGAFS